MKLLLSTTSALALAFGLYAGAAAAQDATKSNQVKPISASEYVQKSAMGDEFEVESSKLALQKAQDPAIKSFAQEMVDEHTTSTNKLKEAATTAKINMASRQKLDSRDQATLSQLRGMSGAQFDQAYMRAQLLGHREALNLQKAYGESGSNATLKAHAQEVQPVVQHHLMEAEKLAAVRVNDTNKSGDAGAKPSENLAAH